MASLNSRLKTVTRAQRLMCIVDDDHSQRTDLLEAFAMHL